MSSDLLDAPLWKRALVYSPLLCVAGGMALTLFVAASRLGGRHGWAVGVPLAAGGCLVGAVVARAGLYVFGGVRASPREGHFWRAAITACAGTGILIGAALEPEMGSVFWPFGAGFLGLAAFWLWRGIRGRPSGSPGGGAADAEPGAAADGGA